MCSTMGTPPLKLRNSNADVGCVPSADCASPEEEMGRHQGTIPDNIVGQIGTSEAANQRRGHERIIAATKKRWALKRAEEAKAKRAAAKRTGTGNRTLKAA